MSWTFTDPWLLIALLAIPCLVATSWRSGALRHRDGQIAMSLRALMIALLTLASAGLSYNDVSDELAVIFVVDTSRSVNHDSDPSSGLQAARDFVRRAITSRPEADLTGVVAFGQEPAIESLVHADSATPSWSATVGGDGTNIEAALRLAFTSFPTNTHRKIVLLSDGIETAGDARSQLTVAREFSTPIDVVPITTKVIGDDPVMESISAPPVLDAAQPFDLKVLLRSPGELKGRLLLFRDDILLGELPIAMKTGLNTLNIPQKLDTAGLHRYSARLDVEGDTEPRNNDGFATVQVKGHPAVLLLDGDPNTSNNLRDTLIASNFRVTAGGINDIPDDLEAMIAHDLIILSDIPASKLSRHQMAAFVHFVSDLGRGLIMTGGDNSFGVGGYFKTPIARVLPVSMTRHANKEMPSQGIVLTLDKSGSMGGGYGSKIAIAKEAASFVAELLTSRDELGVLGFDDAAAWVLTYQRLRDKEEAIRLISTLRAGGGTDIYNALNVALDAIDGGDAPLKHIILISDGVSKSADLSSIAKKIRASNVTISTIAIGGDSDQFTMETLATLGGGRYYATSTPENIPQIFTRETMLASRNFINEETFVPIAGDPSEVLAGIEALPPLRGYVSTSIKPGATLALISPGDEPILAHWRSGLGRTLAFTSDARGRWGKDWLADPALFNRFWGQAAQWTAQGSARDDLAVVTSTRGARLTLVVDSMTDDGYIDGADTTAFVIHPDGRRQQTTLQQISSGRYRAEIDATHEGHYAISVVQSLNGREVSRAFREVYRAWPPEFAPAYTGLPTLQELASASGGRLNPSPDEVWSRPATPITSPRLMTSWILIICAVLWVVDVAARRLSPLRISGRKGNALSLTTTTEDANAVTTSPHPHSPKTPHQPVATSKQAEGSKTEATSRVSGRLLEAKKRRQNK